MDFSNSTSNLAYQCLQTAWHKTKINSLKLLNSNNLISKSSAVIQAKNSHVNILRQSNIHDLSTKFINPFIKIYSKHHEKVKSHSMSFKISHNYHESSEHILAHILIKEVNWKFHLTFLYPKKKSHHLWIHSFTHITEGFIGFYACRFSVISVLFVDFRSVFI